MTDIKVYVEVERQLDSRLQRLIAVRTPDYIVEVGSYDGEVLRQFGLASPYSKTIGFEANPRNFFRFCVGKNIQNMAVSDKIGHVSFFDSTNPGREKTGSLLKKVSETDNERKEVTILSTTLDEFFKIEITRKRSFVLIIDAEGVTWEILRGAQNFLKNTIALKIEVEKETFWKGQKTANEIDKFLENHMLIGINKNPGKGSDIQQNQYYVIKDSPGTLSAFEVI